MVLRHLRTDSLGGSLGSRFFVVKVDMIRNRTSADENILSSKLL